MHKYYLLFVVLIIFIGCGYNRNKSSDGYTKINNNKKMRTELDPSLLEPPNINMLYAQRAYKLFIMYGEKDNSLPYPSLALLESATLFDGVDYREKDFNDMLHGKKEDEKYGAILLLSQNKEFASKYIDTLIGYVKDNDIKLAIMALYSLGALAEKETEGKIRALYEKINKSDDDSFRCAFYYALFRIGQSEETEKIMKNAVEDKNSVVRSFALAFMVKNDRGKYIGKFREMLKSDDLRLRFIAAYIIKDHYDDDSIKAVMEAVVQEKNDEVLIEMFRVLSHARAYRKEAVDLIYKKAIESSDPTALLLTASGAMMDLKFGYAMPKVIALLDNIERYNPDGPSAGSLISTILYSKYFDKYSRSHTLKELKIWWEANKDRILKKEAEKEKTAN